MDYKILPIILAGGFGNRLWPLSQENCPKQFLDLFDGESLFQKTVKRLGGLDDVLNPVVVCNSKHRSIVNTQLKDVKIEPSALVLEPIGRNTAPAIAISALYALAYCENPTLLVLPSDHLLNKVDNFYNAVKLAMQYTDSNLVTFGIKPTSPEIVYGYIKEGSKIKDGVYRIEKFVEKPNIENAKIYLNSGNYSWNSGIFMFKASNILDEIYRYRPDVIKACKIAFDNCLRDNGYMFLEEDDYKTCPLISIDYAVMEKTVNSVVIPVDLGWSDLGSFMALYDNSLKDENNNVKVGKIYSKDTINSYLNSHNRLLVTVGVDNLVIVETDEAIIVVNKNRSDGIKRIIDEDSNCP